MTDSTRPIQRHQPLSAQIAERVRERIESGEWPVGHRVPGEHELAEAMGTSRNTVREAIRGLVHAGLLEARPGDGTYVLASTELEVALKRRASREEINNVFEVRAALEQYGARRAAEQANAAQIETLTQLLDERDEQVDIEEYLATDLAFHLELVRASGNRLLSDLYQDLHQQSTGLPGEGDAQQRNTALRARWQDKDPHRAILEAITQRDPDAAVAAVALLMEQANTLCGESLEETLPQTRKP